jgi:hypothetical protein
MVLAVSQRVPTQPIRIGSHQTTSIPAKHRPRNHFAMFDIADETGVAGDSTFHQKIDLAFSSIGNRPHCHFDHLMRAKCSFESKEPIVQSDVARDPQR